jgi:acyl-CoA synthetase (AMP-forming)/AMP-acid ligase II
LTATYNRSIDRLSTIPQFERVDDYLAYWARTAPGAEAVVFGDARASYAELDAEVERCASALVARGVENGDRVALLGNPTPRYLVVFLACARIGAIWVGLNPKYGPAELGHVVADCEPALSLVALDTDDPLYDPDSLAVLREPLPIPPSDPSAWEAFLAAGAEHSGAVAARAGRVSADQAAAIIYTSGSTGVPKGALIPHGGLTYCGWTQTQVWTADPLRTICDLPINHIGCLGDICVFVLVAGGTIVFLERFDPRRTLEVIERERITLWGGVPAMLLMVTAVPEWETVDRSSLQRIAWGGATAPKELVERLVATGAVVGTSYGSTETVGSITFTDDDAGLDVLTETVGRVHPRYEVRIEAADGGEGEVLVRGRHVTGGYWRNPLATAAAIDEDGWLRTGDVARLRADGNLELVGRTKEMFISGGYNVYPREIELALEEHAGVEVAAAVGVPDATFGEVGWAYVVGAVAEDELHEHVRGRLANYKRPKRIVVAAELPLLPIGKVDKRALAERARSAAGAP